LNTQTSTSRQWTPSPNVYPSEPIFVADPAAGPLEEDNGVLLVGALDTAAKRGKMYILNATDMTQIGVVRDYRTPLVCKSGDDAGRHIDAVRHAQPILSASREFGAKHSTLNCHHHPRARIHFAVVGRFSNFRCKTQHSWRNIPSHCVSFGNEHLGVVAYNHIAAWRSARAVSQLARRARGSLDNGGSADLLPGHSYSLAE